MDKSGWTGPAGTALLILFVQFRCQREQPLGNAKLLKKRRTNV